jgi:CSLREA domain-containing protein
MAPTAEGWALGFDVAGHSVAQAKGGEMRKYVLAIVGLTLLCLLAALGTEIASANTYTVNTTDDTDDGTCDGTHCSLREAINAANSNSGSDTIAFNISTSDSGYQVSGISGTWTISLTSGLPILTDNGTIISGTTQTDLNPDGPEIEITGAGLSFLTCLWIESANNVVHGLVINRCSLNGVLIQTSGAISNTVSGNYIGTDASGSSSLGNKYGVMIGSGAQGNVVGGDTPEERNVISGNDQTGVYIQHDDSDRNTISGNYIGTDATGTQDLGNAQTGVLISYGPQNNTVGGDTAGERNIISGNDGDGVSIGESDTMSNTVSGNFIGVVVSGTQALGNGGDGVQISGGAENNTVGGNTEGERNVISANDRNGVYIVSSGTMSNTVSGNYIGTDAAGSSDLGNAFEGVHIATGAQNNTVGGQTAGERNVLSGNDWHGVHIGGVGADGNVVSGNYIGTDAAGTQPLGNSMDGVGIDEAAQDNTVGGPTAAARNVIAANGGSGIHGLDSDGNTVSHNYIGTDLTGTQDKGNSAYGVSIDGDAQNNTVGPLNLIAHNDSGGVWISGSSTLGNAITENSIHSNVSLGIDLASGGNNLYSAPTVSSVDGCFANVSGTATAGDTVEVFTGPDDEGKRYLASDVADVSDDWEVVGPFRLDTYVTATATDGSGNTSEFSADVESNCHLVFVPLGVKNY